MNKIVPLPLKSSITLRKPLEDDIRLANATTALDYKMQNMFYLTDSNGNQTQFPLTVNLEEFRRHGLGLFLYFKFLAYIIITFFIMSIFASLNCYFNSVGDGLNQWKSLNSLQKLSVGNQLRIDTSNNTTLTQSDLDSFYDKSRTYLYVLSWLDFSYILIFILFLGFFSYWAKKQIDLNLINDKVPATFSLVFKNINSNERNPQELKIFLESLGYPIREVKYAKNYSNTLLLYQYQAKLQVAIKCEEIKERIQKSQPGLKEKLINQYQQIQQQINNIIQKKIGKRLKHTDYPTLQAFVIFQKISDKNKFIIEYKINTQFNFLQLCCGKKIEEKYYFKHQILKIQSKIDNPNNINWENLEVSNTNRFFRQLLVAFTVFCLMIITFFIVFSVNIVSKYSPETCANENYTYDNTQTLINQATTNNEKTTIKNCFCLNQELTSLYTNYLSYCSDIIYQYTAVQALQISSAFVILIVNALLQWLLQSISVFERYTSVSRQLSGTVTKLFFALFINTALITLILKANIYGFELAYYLSSPIPPLQSAQKNEVFPTDFNRDWYAITGASLVNTWIINMITPYFIDFILHPIKNWWRNNQAKNVSIQRELNKLTVGPEFKLELYYANLLNTVFVTLFYSSAIPLMLPFGFIALCIHFLAQKYLLLRYYKKPPAYDEALHEAAFRLIPISVIFHILIAIWVYGSPLIFPVNKTQLTTDGSSIYINEDTVWGRITNTPHLAILGLVFIGVTFIKIGILNPLQFIITYFKKTKEVEDLSKEINYDDVYDEINSIQLATYEITDNEKYTDIIKAIDTDIQTQLQDDLEEQKPLQS